MLPSGVSFLIFYVFSLAFSFKILKNRLKKEHLFISLFQHLIILFVWNIWSPERWNIQIPKNKHNLFRYQFHKVLIDCDGIKQTYSIFLLLFFFRLLCLQVLKCC